MLYDSVFHTVDEPSTVILLSIFIVASIKVKLRGKHKSIQEGMTVVHLLWPMQLAWLLEWIQLLRVMNRKEFSS